MGHAAGVGCGVESVLDSAAWPCEECNVSIDTVQPLLSPHCLVQVILDDPHLRGGDMFCHRQEGVMGSTCVDAQLGQGSRPPPAVRLATSVHNDWWWSQMVGGGRGMMDAATTMGVVGRPHAC